MPVSPYHRAVVDGLVTPAESVKAPGVPVTARESWTGVQPSEKLGVQNRGPGRPSADHPLEWIPVFLGALTRGASVRRAVKESGVCETTVYNRRKTDPAFRRAWCDAADIGTRLMEQEAARRAVRGTLKPIFHKGVRVGMERRYSDTLLIFLLKARKPEVYREGPRVVVGPQTNITAQQAAIQLLNGTLPDDTTPPLPEEIGLKTEYLPRDARVGPAPGTGTRSTGTGGVGAEIEDSAGGK